MKTKCEYAMHFFILFFAFFFQCSPVIERLSVAGVIPNVVFVILLVYSFYLKDAEVVTYAFIIGSFMDVLYGKIYGVNALLLIAFVCIYIILNKYIYTESRIIVFVYCALSTLLYETFLVLVNLAIWEETVAFSKVATVIMIKCVYNAIVILPVFWIARKMHRLKQEVHF